MVKGITGCLIYIPQEAIEIYFPGSLKGTGQGIIRISDFTMRPGNITEELDFIAVCFSRAE
jgi:hypothetical protein